MSSCAIGQTTRAWQQYRVEVTELDALKLDKHLAQPDPYSIPLRNEEA